MRYECHARPIAGSDRHNTPTGTRAERDAHVPDAYADADRHRAGTVICHG